MIDHGRVPAHAAPRHLLADGRGELLGELAVSMQEDRGPQGKAREAATLGTGGAASNRDHGLAQRVRKRANPRLVPATEETESGFRLAGRVNADDLRIVGWQERRRGLLSRRGRCERNAESEAQTEEGRNPLHLPATR